MGSSGNGSRGGMYNSYNNYPTLTDIVFSNNQAGKGGGLWTFAGLSLTRAIINGNRATKGGGVYNLQYAPALADVLFYDNHADYGGGWFSANGAPIRVSSTSHFRAIPPHTTAAGCTTRIPAGQRSPT